MFPCCLTVIFRDEKMVVVSLCLDDLQSMGHVSDGVAMSQCLNVCRNATRERVKRE